MEKIIRLSNPDNFVSVNLCFAGIFYFEYTSESSVKYFENWRQISWNVLKILFAAAGVMMHIDAIRQLNGGQFPFVSIRLTQFLP